MLVGVARGLMYYVCVFTTCPFCLLPPAKGFAVFVFHVVRHDKVWRKIIGICSKPTRALKLKLISSTGSTVSDRGVSLSVQ